MKKVIKTVSLLVACTPVLIGCGGKSEDSNTGQSQFPERDVKLIVPFAVEGGTDAVARALANAAEKHLGSTIVVENKTGGSGAVGMAEGSNSEADGYTVTMMTREIVTLSLIYLSHITAADFDLISNSLFCTPYK